jgi:hypothetical protein
MPYQFHTPYPDDPIVLTVFEGTIASSELQRWWLDMVETVLGRQSPYVYLVIDVQQATSDFGAIFGMYRDGTVARAVAQLADTELIGIVVGSHEMARLSVDLSQHAQFGGVPVTASPNLADAHAFIDLDLQRRLETA